MSRNFGEIFEEGSSRGSFRCDDINMTYLSTRNLGKILSIEYAISPAFSVFSHWGGSCIVCRGILVSNKTAIQPSFLSPSWIKPKSSRIRGYTSEFLRKATNAVKTIMIWTPYLIQACTLLQFVRKTSVVVSSSATPHFNFGQATKYLHFNVEILRLSVNIS